MEERGGGGGGGGGGCINPTSTPQLQLVCLLPGAMFNLVIQKLIFAPDALLTLKSGNKGLPSPQHVLPDFLCKVCKWRPLVCNS